MSLTPIEYLTLVEQAPILIWRSNTSGACDYFNERWLEFTGRTFDQEKGDGWADGVHQEDLRACFEGYMNAFTARVPFELRYRLRRHDGQYRWIFDRGAPYRDEKGQFAGYIGSCIDITEQVEAQRKLEFIRQRELQQLRGLLPICTYCKKVRNDNGYWIAVDAYVRQHSSADFSHGCCPECLKNHHPAVAEL